jgi:branched-subunit amino acid transport protein
VGDITLPAIYFIFIQRYFSNKFVSKVFEPVNKLDLPKFFSTLISFIVVLLITYLTIQYIITTLKMRNPGQSRPRLSTKGLRHRNKSVEYIMKTPQNYDTIIVGAGIAGLYAAYKIKKQDPEHRLLILEREDHIGGRMGTVNFHGSSIAIGAGVGRKRKDKLLKKLLQELRIPTHEFKVQTHYAENIRRTLRCQTYI